MLVLSQLFFTIAINLPRIFATSGIQELPHCDDEKLGLVLISTLDGKLSALDSAGDLKWEFVSGSGALLKSSIHSFDLWNNGENVRIIPSLTGSLYKFNGKTIDALPIRAEHLLSSSTMFTSDLVIAGGREVRTYGINLRNGRRIYECDMAGCRNTSTDASDGSDDYTPVQSEVQDVLLLERNTLTLRAHEPRQGKEIWNVSVAQHNIRMPQSHCINVDVSVASLQLRAILPDGVVSALTFHSQEEEASLKWRHSFGSPIVNVWTWDGKDLLDVDLFLSEFVEEEEENVLSGSSVKRKQKLVPTPAIYLAAHQKQLYIHESRKMLEMLRINPNNGDNNPYLNNHIITRPSKHTISTTRIPFNHDQALAIYRNDWDTVNGNGYYLYTEEDNQKPKLFDNCTDKLGNFQLNKQYTAILSVILQSVPAIILTAFFYYMFFVRPRRHSRIAPNRKTDTTLSKVNGCATSYLPTYARNNTVLTAPVPPFCTDEDIELMPCQSSTSVVMPLLSEKRQEVEQIEIVDTPFASRYANDFETLRCLGKGGFGVVFEVEQKIDECRYAIKRITIPDKERNKRVVLREVQALAKLEHAHIVRYFNSWIEHPPPDWIKDHDQSFFEPGESLQFISPSSVSSATTPSHPERISSSSTSESSSEDEGDKEHSTPKNGKKRRRTLVGQHTDTIVVDLTPNLDDTNTNSSSSDGIVFEPGSIDANLEDQTEDVDNESDTRRIRNASVCLYIQMQLCQKESLRDWLNEHRKERDRFFTMQMFKQIVDAVGYVHQHGLIHRDLKPNNVFFAMNGAIKIGDFGLVKTMADLDWCEQHKTDDGGRHSSAMYRSHTKEVGTHLYMSPEQAAGNRYNYKVDVYALGIILFELLVPFHTDSERIFVLQKLRQHTYPQSFGNHFIEEKELLNKMLAKDPHERPSTTDIQTIPFISNA